MASTASRNGMLVSSAPLGIPLYPEVDPTVKYLSGTLGYVDSSNMAQLVANNAPDGDVVGVFLQELDAASADNLATHIELWVGKQIVLNNDATNPITFVGETCYLFDNDTVEAAAGLGSFVVGIATELNPDGVADTVKVQLRQTV